MQYQQNNHSNARFHTRLITFFWVLALAAALNIYSGLSAIGNAMQAGSGTVVFIALWGITFLMALWVLKIEKRAVVILFLWGFCFVLTSVATQAPLVAWALAGFHLACLATGMAIGQAIPLERFFKGFVSFGFGAIVVSLIGYALDLPAFRLADGLGRTNWLGLEPMSGVFSHKIFAAQSGILVAVSILLLRGRYWKAKLGLCAIFVSLTDSYGGYLFGLAAILAVYGFLSLWRFAPTLAVIYTCLGAALLAVLLPHLISLAEGFAGRDFGNLTGRVTIWQAFFTSHSDQIWLGVGYGQAVSDGYFLSQFNSLSAGTYVPPNLHNTYLQALGDFGILGLVLLLGTLFWALFRCLTAYRVAPHKPLYISILSLVFFALSGLVEVTFSYNSFGTMLLGLLSAADLLQQHQPHKPWRQDQIAAPQAAGFADEAEQPFKA